MVGRLERVKLRDVWSHETTDFTRWLEENIDVISEVTGLHLTSIGREMAAGSFSVDLVAVDEVGRLVIIENQLEKSNHDHLGKLITYLTALEAKTAIWIVKDPWPEHATAITWLNQTTPVSFYLLKLEAVRVDGSKPAPLLTHIAGPTEAGRTIGDQKNQLVAYQNVLQRFWYELLERARGRTNLHSDVLPTPFNWLRKRIGTSRVYFAYTVTRDSGRVELEIEAADTALNRRIFDQIHAKRDDIEQGLGQGLEWAGRSYYYIKWHLPVRGYQNERFWAEDQNKMIDAMVRFEAALRPHVDSALREQPRGGDDGEL